MGRSSSVEDVDIVPTGMTGVDFQLSGVTSPNVLADLWTLQRTEAARNLEHTSSRLPRQSSSQACPS